MAKQDSTPTPVAEAPAAESTLSIDVKVRDVGPARKSLTIEVPADKIAEQIGQRFDRLQDEAAVPGFRRGNAPRRLLTRRFSDAVRDEVRTQLLSEAYNQAIEQEKLQVLGEPDFKDIESIKLPDEPGQPLSFQVEVEVTPTFELPELEGVAVKRPRLEVTDKDVDEQVDRLRTQFGSLTEVTDGKADADDYVLADVRIRAGDNADDAAEELAHHPGTYILVPSKQRDDKGHVAGIVITDLGKKLRGKAVGDELRISLTGPSGHEDPRIKDQPITLVIRLDKIERVTPAAIEDLSAQMGVESADDLRQRIRQDLQARRDREQKAAMHDQISDYLLETVAMDLPEGISGRQAARNLQRQALELAYRGASEDEIAQHIAEMRGETEERAQRQLKLSFILQQAAEKLAVEVSEGEINGRIAMLAMQQGRRPEKVRRDMLRNGQLEQLYGQVRDQKTLDLILEKAKVTDVDPAELTQAAEAKAQTKSKSKAGAKKSKAAGAKAKGAKASDAEKQDA